MLKDLDERKLYKYVVVSVSIFAMFILFMTWLCSIVPIEKMGAFGDSFGVLTSLFSGLAFAGIIISLRMQKHELSLQREELKQTREELKGQKEEMQLQNQTMQLQQFENTFFKMIEFLDNCRSDIQCSSDRGENLEGRDVVA